MSTLNLFSTETPKPDHLSEIKTRLNKLDMIRTFTEINGTSFDSRIIYTLPATCEHQAFTRSGMNEYKCEAQNCKGFIIFKHIQKLL